MRRIEGYIDIDEILNNIISTTPANKKNIINYSSMNTSKISFSFFYGNDEYFYKYKYNSIPYNELVANELLKDFELPYVEYDLALYDGHKGVISKNYKDNNSNYILGEEILLNFWNDNLYIEEHNNLDDIWDALEYRYRNRENKREIIFNLMNKIVGIYLFDIIACQSDRHSLNWEIMENNEVVDIGPIYDNEKILSTNGKCAFTLITTDQQVDSMIINNIKEFQKVSSADYVELMKQKIWIISEENLHSIFERIENKTGYPMPEEYKKYYINEYKTHRQRLEKVLGDYNVKEGDELSERKSR